MLPPVDPLAPPPVEGEVPADPAEPAAPTG
jgi:hypothetical protein